MIDTLLKFGLLPDFAIRMGIRHLLAQRLRDEAQPTEEALQSYLENYAADLRTRHIAEQTQAANEQHYEVPAEFYKLCLGERLKYSGCLYPRGDESLDEAELAMLELYAERASLVDGMSILDLGCGWGSLTLFLAERYPQSKITSVSNSYSQRGHIERECERRNLKNVRVITGDINEVELPVNTFDRALSIEMFEHMKNYKRLLAKVAGALRQDGMLFVHIFTHHRLAYHFVSQGPSDWMARYFFTGGQMPSHDLLSRFDLDLTQVKDWKVDGTHYQKTAEHWLNNMDRNRERIMELFSETYGPKHARKWWSYWRVFYMSCAELWGYREGQEWIVSHYLFKKAGAAKQENQT